MSDSGIPRDDEKNCPYIKRQYYKKGVCQLRVTSGGAKPIKAEVADGVINLCSLNDKMCLLEFDFECDTYKEWLEGANNATLGTG